MNKTCREAISEFRGMLKMENKDINSLLSDRLILSKLQNIGLKFIKQRTNKRSLWNSPNIFTPIPCVSLKPVPLAECCGYTSPCTIRRSIVQLPKIAEGNDFNMLIQGIWSIDTISRKFIESDPNRYTNSLSLGLHTKEIHFWIQDKYLYLGDENIEKIKISAYFEEDIPLCLQSFPDYCNIPDLVGCCPDSSQTTNVRDMSLCCPKNPFDEELKIPGYLMPDVYTTLLQEFLGSFTRIKDTDKTQGIIKE